MKPSKPMASTPDTSVYRIFWSAEEFQKLFLMSFFFHAILISLLLMFYPIWFVFSIACCGFGVWIWTCMSAKKAFDYLTSNYLHCCTIHAMAVTYFVLGFGGACYHFSEQSRWLFIALSVFGLWSLYSTATLGFSAGMRTHELHLKKRTSSIDWDSGVYDVRSHSLDSVDINSAIIKSVHTWKWFAGITIALAPGPVVAILAGKVSTHAQFMIAIPAFWGAAMGFGYFLMRMSLDFWSVRKMEKNRNRKLLISTSRFVSQS